MPPPVYRPAPPRLNAPPVYRPLVGPLLTKSAPVQTAPPVYRPNVGPLVAKAAPQRTAPPVYRPVLAARPPAPAPPAFVAQRNQLQAKPAAPAILSATMKPAVPRLVPAPPPVFSYPSTVQRVNHKKRILNVISFGIRYKYVRYKRAQAAAAALNIVPLPQPQDEPRGTNTPLTPVKGHYEQGGDYSLEDLYTHLRAYEQARYYQATKEKSIESILPTGLKREYGGSAEGASATADPGSRKGNEGKVFVGGDRMTAQYYERQLSADKTTTPETLRVFVPKGIAETLVADQGDDDNEAYWTAEHDIPPQSILRGKFSAAGDEELRSVFEVVRQWYPQPDTVDVDEVIARHQEAIRRGLTVHRTRPGRLGRGRFIRDVKNPEQGGYGVDEGYESD